MSAKSPPRRDNYRDENVLNTFVKSNGCCSTPLRVLPLSFPEFPLLSRLTDPALRERLVRGIPRESPQLRGLMSSAVAEEIKDPAERDRLAKLLN